LTAWIGLAEQDQGCQNVAGGRRGNGAERNDLADRKPGAADKAAERIPVVKRRFRFFLKYIIANLIIIWYSTLKYFFLNPSSKKYLISMSFLFIYLLKRLIIGVLINILV
jgi:hypothetical protein